MRRPSCTLIFLLIIASLLTQAQAPAPAPTAGPVTVPVTLDHNRIVIDVYVPVKDAAPRRVRGLIDTGTTELMLSPRVVKLTGGVLDCDGDWCTADAPAEIAIGGMKVSLAVTGKARVPKRADSVNDVMVPGMSPEVLIPATVLKKYDIVIDYANRQFTIGQPGSVKFTGSPITAKISENGLASITGQIANAGSTFGLDTGLSATVVSSEQLKDWHKEHPGWPYLVGAIGAANMTGDAEEISREMMRLPSLQLGTSHLRDVLIASGSKTVDRFVQESHVAVVGVIGGEALRGTKLGIDYAHAKAYIDVPDLSPSAAIDAVGLTLRPEVDGKYTIVAVLPYEGKLPMPEIKTGDLLIGVDGAPVTGATMGQVWSLLGGEAGQTRKLVLERNGERLTVEAAVHRWMTPKDK